MSARTRRSRARPLPARATPHPRAPPPTHPHPPRPPPSPSPRSAGRAGAPKRRLLWLDIGDPATPILVWQDGEILDRARVKDKDRLALIDILDIKAGQVSLSLMRSGRPQHAERYLSFTAEERTFDVEAPSPEGRDWLFKKFADLFQAYATAKIEGREGDAITLRVAELMDAPPRKPAAESPRRRSAGGRSAGGGGGDDYGSPRGAAAGGRGSYYDDGSMGRRRASAQPGRMPAPAPARGGGGGSGYY